MKQSLTIITTWIRFIFPLKKFYRVVAVVVARRWVREGKWKITARDLNIFLSVDMKAFSQYPGILYKKNSEFALNMK